jgi:hypothetical protein
MVHRGGGDAGAGGASRARSNGSHPPAPGAPGVVIAKSIADGGADPVAAVAATDNAPLAPERAAGTKQREASAMGAPGLRVSAGPRWRRARWAASSSARAVVHSRRGTGAAWMAYSNDGARKRRRPDGLC